MVRMVQSINNRDYMRTATLRLCSVSLCVLLCLCYSCGGTEDQYEYARPSTLSSSNLNMRGEPLKKQDPENVAQVQSALKTLGYNPGPVDGTYNPQTKNAVMRFQKAYGLCTDGCIGAMTENSIRKAIQAREALQKNTPKSMQSPAGSNP